jgi:hypothetical protein
MAGLAERKSAAKRILRMDCLGGSDCNCESITVLSGIRRLAWWSAVSVSESEDGSHSREECWLNYLEVSLWRRTAKTSGDCPFACPKCEVRAMLHFYPSSHFPMGRYRFGPT